MTLSRKMIIKTIALVVGLGLLGGTSLWGLAGLRVDVRLARDEYSELRIIQNVGMRVAAAKALLQTRLADRPAVLDELRAALRRLESFLSFQETQGAPGPADQAQELVVAKKARADLHALLAELTTRPGVPLAEPAAARMQTMLAGMVLDLNELVSEMDEEIATAQTDATSKLRTAIVLMGVLSAVIVAAAAVINVSQYRSVIRPLGDLRRAVHRIASGDFTAPMAVGGDREFRELAADFDRMAGQLDELYRNLEEKVRLKSKELTQSERLASVGFLAAGVAHEINNPLATISGHAELALKRLQNPPARTDGEPIAQALAIIRDEAFRCKDIIRKLLDLAQMNKIVRQTVSMTRAAEDVASMVRGLKQYRDREVLVRLEDADNFTVQANDTELRQVLLNLTVNALEAVEPGRGKVWIEGRRRRGKIELSVRDNGRGMTPDTLERVFEPFFTARRGGTGHGVGLGLSITHAIIESHGGRLTAQSEGPGRGSKFTIQLPAAGERN